MIRLKWDKELEKIKREINKSFELKLLLKGVILTSRRSCKSAQEEVSRLEKKATRLSFSGNAFESAQGLRSKRLDSELKKAKDVLRARKRELSQATRDLDGAAAEFDRYTQAYQERLYFLTESEKVKNDLDRQMARKAGVPPEYLSDILVLVRPVKGSFSEGVVHVYYGGIGPPDGLGHGHNVMDFDGNVTYERPPFRPHGRQNVVSS